MARDSVSAKAAHVSIDRLPPYSEEAERGVLGSILLDSQTVLDLCVAASLVPESFYVPAHRVLFEAVCALQTQSVVVDALTVTERLQRAGRLDEIGGTVFLERLVDGTPTAAHAEHYIDIVRQKHLLRSVIDCARSTERICYESDENADLVLDRAEQAFLDITERQHGHLAAWSEAVKTTMEHIENVFNGSAMLSGISTGFANLDRKALGLRPSEMIVLAARPSMGKTSLAMNIAENVALGRGRDNKSAPVGIFSLEMSQEALAMRLLCGCAGVSAFKLQGGFVSPTIHGKLMQAASVMSKAPLFVDDTGGLDILELRARARRMQKKHDVGLIVVDYLQLLHAREYARHGRQIETANISGHLKAMAKELKVPVLVLSQLSRAPEQRDKSGRPKLSDLRDSGAIEQDADMVWMLRRPSKYDGDPEHEDETLAIVDVVKQRNGPTGEVRLNFEEQYTRFRDRAHGVDEPDAIPAMEEPADDEPL